MDTVRQTAFQKLRPTCVQLSSLALKFRAQQASAKELLQALNQLHDGLTEQGQADSLDEKLAEYAFFPLSHVFNESQRLSSRPLEVAVRCLQTLVSRGWRGKLAPELGKQLLILCTLLAGGSSTNKRAEAPGEDLKVATSECIQSILKCMGTSARLKSMFDEVGPRNVVDQIVYVLLEAISEDPSDNVQLAASKALSQLHEVITNRLVLASLLPRTVSALTKALRPSLQARRTYKVMETNLELLRTTLYSVLNDGAAIASQEIVGTLAGSEKSPQKDSSEKPQLLDQSWLKATSSQVRIALVNVSQLRRHGRVEVRSALARLCLMIIEECPLSLADSVPVMVETLIVLAGGRDCPEAFSGLKHLLISDSSLADHVKASLHKWTSSLPRLMQASDDRPRERILAQISSTVELLSAIGQASTVIQQSLPLTLIDSVMVAVRPLTGKLITTVCEPQVSLAQLLIAQGTEIHATFRSVILTHRSQKGSLAELEAMVAALGKTQEGATITRTIIDTIPSADSTGQLSAMWLALQLLKESSTTEDLHEFLVVPQSSRDLSTSRPFLISDLYSFTLPLLLGSNDGVANADYRWQLQALGLECLILQASQLGISYRPELIDSLYPVLSLLSSPDPSLQQHAVTALNLLATACQYDSATDMLVENVDYLVNSIAIKFNSFDLTPQAPQVLLMMVRLCGARLIPHLDDLISSIFAALDNFHGYPQLVELLFEVLGAVVDEGAKQPALTITDGKKAPEHSKSAYQPSSIEDILSDLPITKSRKRNSDGDHEDSIKSAPRRPWNDNLDGPTQQITSNKQDAEASLNGDEEGALPAPTDKEEKEVPLSKPHRLLLSIGQAATPHLSSPSPKVRQTLLQLLDRIAPLLAHDENSFLPLVNTIWPALVSRLFDEVGTDGDGESAFNVCGAADAVSKLCQSAGDFMASRIEDIFPRLEKVFRQIWSKVEEDRARRSRRSKRIAPATQDLVGSVDLRLAKRELVEVDVAKSSSLPLLNLQRTPDRQIFNALVNLFIAILNFVNVTDDNRDAMIRMLAPIMDDPGREVVSKAVSRWNPDAVWLIRERKKIERDMLDGLRTTEDWTWEGALTPSLPANVIPAFLLREIVF